MKQSFFEDHNLEEFKYYQFHHYRNSDFFFANYIILAESKNDVEVIKFLARSKNIDLDLYGISLLNIDGVGNLAYPFHIVNDLKLPYIVILDKDYFLPYLNDELNLSRNNKGFPKYRNEFVNGNLLDDLIPNQPDQIKLLNLLNRNHSKALDHLNKFNIICMNFNLEMDLLCSDAAVEKMSSILGLKSHESNVKFLLESKSSAIKKIDRILKVLSQIEIRNLPNSYKRIRNKLEEITKEI